MLGAAKEIIINNSQNPEYMIDVTGIILAGGVSRRLGYRNKALLEIDGKSIIEHVIEALSGATENIVLITNSPGDYEFLGLPMFRDIIPDSGSLGGIYTGLRLSKTHYNLVIACDMPFIKPHLLLSLIRNSKGYDVGVPMTPDGYHPTCAVYSRNCIDAIEAQIVARHLKITDFFPHVKVRTLDLQTLCPLCDANIFFNINTEEDYMKALTMIDQYLNIIHSY